MDDLPLEVWADLHAAIRKWAEEARPGEVFCTQASVVVATSVRHSLEMDETCPGCGSGDLSYEPFEPQEDGEVEQKVECDSCGARWTDVFTLWERRHLPRARGGGKGGS